VAAGVTPAVEALTQVLREMLAHSRIMQALDQIIGQTLGLLVDLVLLPFLPILIWVLKGILTEVIAFGKWWNEFWKGDGKELLAALKTIAGFAGDLIKMAIEFSFKPLGAFIDLGINFLKWLWGASTGAIDTAIDVAMNAAGAVYDFLVWLWGIATTAAGIAIDALFKIPGMVGDLLNWLWGLGTGLGTFAAELAMNIPEPVKGILDWLMGIAGGIVSFTLDIAKSVTESVNPAVDWIKDILGFANGGVVPGAAGEPRIVKAHGGEVITPANQSGGTMSVSISGTLFRDEEDMYQRVFDRLRAELWRQNV
jgi:hypothetical protein